MKLCFDMRIYEGSMHGMARYGRELLLALLDQHPDLAVAVLIRKLEHSAIFPNDPRLVCVVANFPPYGIGAQLRLPTVLRAMDFDVYHCPFYAPPVVVDRPMVMTIHDLIHLRFPKDHGLRHRLFYKYVVRPAAFRAGAILTVSEHSKRDVVDILGVSEDKVTITPNGVGPEFVPLEPEHRESAARAVGLPPRYILGVGNPKPHKNLAALVEAHKLLGPDAPPLVLVGVEPGRLAGAKPGPEVQMLPGLPDKSLATAYAAADVVCIPSLYEGFGLPALEALACGAPLVASNRASLPEVVGAAGLLCEPEPEALAENIRRVLADDKLAADLRLAGPRRARHFQWADAARVTYDVYEQVLALAQAEEA